MRKQLGLIIDEEDIRLAENTTIRQQRRRVINKKPAVKNQKVEFHVAETCNTFCAFEVKMRLKKKKNADASLIEWKSHRPEVAYGDLINHFRGSRAFETLHGVSHGLLGLQQIDQH